MSELEQNLDNFIDAVNLPTPVAVMGRRRFLAVTTVFLASLAAGCESSPQPQPTQRPYFPIASETPAALIRPEVSRTFAEAEAIMRAAINPSFAASNPVILSTEDIGGFLHILGGEYSSYEAMLDPDLRGAVKFGFNGPKDLEDREIIVRDISLNMVDSSAPSSRLHVSPFSNRFRSFRQYLTFTERESRRLSTGELYVPWEASISTDNELRRRLLETIFQVPEGMVFEEEKEGYLRGELFGRYKSSDGSKLTISTLKGTNLSYSLKSPEIWQKDDLVAVLNRWIPLEPRMSADMTYRSLSQVGDNGQIKTWELSRYHFDGKATVTTQFGADYELVGTLVEGVLDPAKIIYSRFGRPSTDEDNPRRWAYAAFNFVSEISTVQVEQDGTARFNSIFHPDDPQYELEIHPNGHFRLQVVEPAK